MAQPPQDLDSRRDRLLGVTPLVVGDLILVEVVQGFRHERDMATARRLFSSFVGPVGRAAIGPRKTRMVKSVKPGLATPFF